MTSWNSSQQRRFCNTPLQPLPILFGSCFDPGPPLTHLVDQRAGRPPSRTSEGLWKQKSNRCSGINESTWLKMVQGMMICRHWQEFRAYRQQLHTIELDLNLFRNMIVPKKVYSFALGLVHSHISHTLFRRLHNEIHIFFVKDAQTRIPKWCSSPQIGSAWQL